MKDVVDKLYNDWTKIYTVQLEMDPMHLINKDKDRIRKLYKELKDGVQFEDINFGNQKNISTVSTIDECIERINGLAYKIKRNKCKARYSQYETGEVIVKLKEITESKKHFQTVIKKSCNCSVSYAYFLIRLYKACKNYPNLKYTTMATAKLKNNFTDLLNFMKADMAFWQLPNNALKPSTSNSV